MRDNWYALTNGPRKLAIRKIMNDYNGHVYFSDTCKNRRVLNACVRACQE